MTYLELYEKANKMLDNNDITIGEYEKMIKPLVAEVARWIPCNERLPKDDEIVMVTACFYGEPLMFRAYLEGGEWIGEEATHWSRESILAWMPLPEPWKGEEDGGSN